jgi:hypothetical protein
MGGNQCIGDARVLGNLLERRIHQDQSTGRFRRQERGESVQSVATMDAHPSVAAEMAAQRLRLRRVKLHQDQSVVGAQAMGGESGGARIGCESAVRIERRDGPEIGRKLRKGVAPLPESLDPEPKLRGLERLLGPEVVTACTGVRLNVDQRFGFGQKRVEQQDQDRMLEDVGVIAGVKAVKIA